MNASTAEDTVRRFVEAFDAADLAGINYCLAEDLLSDVTQADGTTALLEGRDAYSKAIAAMDIATVRPSIKATQIAPVSGDQVMVMVEIRASRKGRHLHNFAAFLMQVRENRICRIWMVEALPAESDRFWKD